MNEACIMQIPPMYSTIRVNTNNIAIEEAKEKLNILLQNQYKTRGCNERVDVETHPQLKDLLIIKSLGPFLVEPVQIEVYVDEACGSAVMRGADIFACGVLASNGNFSIGDKVSAFIDLSGKCLRGTTNALCTEAKQFLGNGIMRKNRKELFTVDQKELRGVGIEMTQPIYVHPKFEDLDIDSWALAQNLPSVLCCHVLDPQPEDTVLDLCAAPGGKSTHLATLMNDEGKVVCIDVSANRLELISKKAKLQGLKSIEVRRADGTNLTECDKNTKPIYPVEFFDKVLVDAPCSCLGARPFARRINPTQVASYPQIQRKLLKTACQLLKNGGTLVYSTCTLTTAENEENVEYVLKTFPYMVLVSQEPFVLNAPPFDSQPPANFLQKFDPRSVCSVHKSSECLSNGVVHNRHWNPYSVPANLSYNVDTVGFFIAKFRKHS